MWKDIVSKHRSWINYKNSLLCATCDNFKFVKYIYQFYSYFVG